ncbi:MAG TPA: hypothetical protein VGA73_17700 [Candidatus Binatia bacterium]
MRSRAFGYLLFIIAFSATAVALFFGYHGARLIYIAAVFGDQGPLNQGMDIALGLFSYITVVTAAVLFPLIAVVAALIAWLCWGVGLGMMREE